MPPATATESGPAPRRIWPMTALLVTLAFLLVLYQMFGVAIMTAPFFGETPQRDDYISAGMACLTTLPAFAAMIWCGWQHGSRHGLSLIWVSAALLSYEGLHLLAYDSGSSRDPNPHRTPDLTDLFVDVTWLNWGVVVVFGGCSVATHLRRRRARHTEKASHAYS